MIERLQSSRSIAAIQDALRLGSSILVEELWGVTKAILAVLAVQMTNKSVLLLTGGMREDKLVENLLQLAPHLPIEFPAWETLPGEDIAPSPDIIGKRMEALHALIHKKGPSIVLCPITSFLQKVPAKEQLSFATWKKKSIVPFAQIPTLLTQLGYRREAIVSDKGEFAIRGGIVDVFPVGSSDPYRVDFFEDEIDSIRTFDPVGQKSIEKVDELFLSPAKELPLAQTAEQLVSIADYLDHPILMWDDILAIEDAYDALRNMPGAKSNFFFTLEAMLTRFDRAQQIFCTGHKIEELSEFKDETFQFLEHTFRAKRCFHHFRKIDDAYDLDHFEPEKNLTLYFLNSNETEEAEVIKKFSEISLPQNTHFEKGYLTSGFLLADIPLAMIPNSEISNRTRVRRQKQRSTYHTPASDFHQLTPGDMVVHYHSGIGKFLGMEKQINLQGVESEFMAIQYAETSKLFVPLSQAYLVSRYIGSHEESPPLSQLGSNRWQVAKQRAQAQITGYASDLLQHYASRAAHGGFQYHPDSLYMNQFEGDFPYQETQDQLLSIQAIKDDMMSEKAMDRMICGDVGYGKTEVAMRAAFKAVVDGQKQVAVLVPTTVLAMQHYETFKARMAGFPVVVDVVSRFRTPKEVKATLKAVEEGKVDILVGTHRLLSKDVLFKELGLIIIDEEQKFGVRSKEHLKKLKLGVDCLTLSATPIPRTLYMSLVGARDMSTINTPPQDRLPIKTIIAETDEEVIANALMRELARGGQAFFIHNRVETIHLKAAAIQKLVPAARIGVVHGQMDTEEIDPIFHNFKQGNLDILFATTIVENGIDIPNANTILIDRADTHGLADLYQLRGRVGRWNRAAYAYFLIPKKASLPELTRKRLNALVEAGGYGGGMKIAMRDLEIRGAGDILGENQSGQVSAIGFHLYCKLLKRAIDSLKKQRVITFEETRLEFPFDARIPEKYISEVSLRMEIYHRFGDAGTYQELDDLLAELKDRFGIPPLPVFWLYHISRIRAFASLNQFTLIRLNQTVLLMEQQKGKTIEKKSLPAPRKITNPQELETIVIEQLKKQFSCPREPI